MNEQKTEANLCRAGCGFYGSSATDGLCSKCFKETINEKQDVTKHRPNVTSSSDTLDSKNVASFVANLSEICSSSSMNVERMGSGQEEVQTAMDAQTSASVSTETSIPEEMAGSEGGSGSNSQQKKTNRCHTCNKRVGLMGFPCRCGGLYCNEHRYDNTHNCTFDYKTVEREEIRKKNPLVVSDKIQKI